MRTRHLVVTGIAMITLGAIGCSSEPSGNSTGGSGGQTAGTGGNGGGGTGGNAGAGGGSGGSATGTGGSPTGSGGSATGTGGSATGSGGTGGAVVDGGAQEGGVDGAGGNIVPGDTPPWRALNVTAARMRLTHTFRAGAADPAVSFNDGTQIAAVDPRSPKMVGKLVLPFGGRGATNGGLGNEGAFLLPRGYHVLGIAAFQDYGILRCDADFFGDARRTVFEGVMHTNKFDFANVRMVPSDGVAKRTEMALKYLHQMYPTEDWGYFLNQDGTVRWNDVIFTGISHGGSNAPRFAMLVRAWRSVSFAGPRDNSAGSMPNDPETAYCPTPVTAKWLMETPATPIDRFYALTGVGDSQHPQHLFAMETLGFSGQPVNMSVGAPWNNSHRINGPGGHESPCNETTYRAVCNYLFGVDPLNANGIQ